MDVKFPYNTLNKFTNDKPKIKHRLEILLHYEHIFLKEINFDTLSM